MIFYLSNEFSERKLNEKRIHEGRMVMCCTKISLQLIFTKYVDCHTSISTLRIEFESLTSLIHFTDPFSIPFPFPFPEGRKEGGREEEGRKQ